MPTLLRLPFGFPLDRLPPQHTDEGAIHRDDPPVEGELAARARLGAAMRAAIIPGVTNMLDKFA